MDLSAIRQLLSFRDIRNAILGTVVVLGGIGLSLLTLYAHRSGDARLAGISAAASLIFVLLILIFIVPPLARNAGKEAAQMNLPFDFTIGGAIMLGLIVIVGFSAWNTANNLLFLILSFMTAAMIVGFFAGSACLKKIDVKMRFPETIFAGEETPILVSLHNRKRVFPTYSIVVEVRGQERERSSVLDDLKKILPAGLAERLARPPIIRRTLEYFVHIPQDSLVESKVSHIFENRGRFLIKDFELTTGFPFGFFRHRRRLPAKEAALIVFPAILPIDARTSELALAAGQLNVNKRGMGQDLLALRDYGPNDDIRRIDWKATARTRQITVREFSAEDDRRVTVIFDTRIPENEGEQLSLRDRIRAEQDGSVIRSERFEKGVSAAASLIGHLTAEKASVKLIVDNDTGDFGSGKQHLHECLKKFALVEPAFISETDGRDGIFDRYAEAFEDLPGSHFYLFTAMDRNLMPAELMQNLRVIDF